LSVFGDEPLADLPLAGAPVVAGGRVVGVLIGMDPTHSLLAVEASQCGPLLTQVESSPDRRVDQIRAAAYSGVEGLSTLLQTLRDASGLTPEILADAAKALIGEGRLQEALTTIQFAPSGFLADQTRGLILSHLGQHSDAIAVLRPLVESGYRDPETLSLLAGSYKRLWLTTHNADFLEEASERYKETYEASGDPYPGINAAALALYRGDRATSIAIAKTLVRRLSDVAEDDRADVWTKATLAEALLLSGDIPRARQVYRLAVGSSQGRWRNVAAMRRQARLNLEYLGLDRTMLDTDLPVPGVMGFAGQPCDGPRVSRPQFPESGLPRLRTLLRKTLADGDVQQGFSSLARGADLVFVDEVLRRGGHVTVFLPEDDDDFRRECVGFGWDGTFNEVLHEERVKIERVAVSEGSNVRGGWEAYASCAKRAAQACAEYARLLDQEPRALLAWTGPEHDEMSAVWEKEGVRVTEVWSSLAAPAL
jgi:tetratricopeptide (TPR) repeat protein